MRKIGTALFLFAISVAASAQSAGWKQFSVPETGASVQLPAAIFDKDAGRPETGYGHRFTTAGGRATLAVQSMTNEAKIHLSHSWQRNIRRRTLRTAGSRGDILSFPAPLVRSLQLRGPANKLRFDQLSSCRKAPVGRYRHADQPLII